MILLLLLLAHAESINRTADNEIPREVYSWGIRRVDLNTVPAPADNPITKEKIALGRKLFFDPVLSGSNTTSCGTCHNPHRSFSDALSKPVRDNGSQAPRRAPTLTNLAWNEVVFWDGRASSLEEQVAADKSMGQDQASWSTELFEAGYLPLFQKAFGQTDSAISLINIMKAIATYERTLISHDSPFDRFVSGDTTALDASQKHGLLLFSTKAKCSQCHNGPNFTDGGFHDIGVSGEDVGRFAKVPLPVLKFSFKTPGLRDVSKRAPYMHDGSVHTLEDVVAMYNAGGRTSDRKVSSQITPLGLTTSEQKDLVNFLRALDGKINY
jgi:cytochrome c peroxidase